MRSAIRSAAPLCVAANASARVLAMVCSSLPTTCSARRNACAMSGSCQAAPASAACLAASAKLNVDGPITIGQPQAAASIRLWPPSAMKLPPRRATSELA